MQTIFGVKYLYFCLLCRAGAAVLLLYQSRGEKLLEVRQFENCPPSSYF